MFERLSVCWLCHASVRFSIRGCVEAIPRSCVGEEVEQLHNLAFQLHQERQPVARSPFLAVLGQHVIPPIGMAHWHRSTFTTHLPLHWLQTRQVTSSSRVSPPSRSESPSPSEQPPSNRWRLLHYSLSSPCTTTISLHSFSGEGSCPGAFRFPSNPSLIYQPRRGGGVASSFEDHLKIRTQLRGPEFSPGSSSSDIRGVAGHAVWRRRGKRGNG